MNGTCDCWRIECEPAHKIDSFVFYMSDGFTRGMCKNCTYLRCDLPE